MHIIALHVHVYVHILVVLGNLRDMICEDGVCSMYVNNEQWNTTVKLNVCHVIRSVVKGTAYLHESMCIQLVDLKGE